MRLACALCGRPTVPFVMIGSEPIGPKCAQRHGLTKIPARRSRVRLFSPARKAAPGPKNLDLFDDLP